jgi:hypothetical protein
VPRPTNSKYVRLTAHDQVQLHLETDLALDDGRTLHVYDTGTGEGTAGLAVFWHHGTPSTGAPPEPLFAAAAERGIRWVSHDRPGYGGSTQPTNHMTAEHPSWQARQLSAVRFFLPPGLANSDVKPAHKAATDFCEQPDTLLEPLGVASTGSRQLVLGIALVPCGQPRSKIQRKLQRS